MHVYIYENETVPAKPSETSVLLGPAELGSRLQWLLMSANGVHMRNTIMPTGLVVWFVSSENHKWLQGKQEDHGKASNTSRYTNTKTDISVPKS